MHTLNADSPICGQCGAVYLLPPKLREPIDTAARAAGWRVWRGRTQGGTHVDTAICPTCMAAELPAADGPSLDQPELFPTDPPTVRKETPR